MLNRCVSQNLFTSISPTTQFHCLLCCFAPNMRASSLYFRLQLRYPRPADGRIAL